MTQAKNNQRLLVLLSAFGVDSSSKRQASFAFSSKSQMPGWIAYSYVAAVPFFLLEAEGSRATQVYSFASGINKEAFILVADLGEKVAIVMRRPGKEGDPYLRLLLQKEEDFERAGGVLRKLNFLSDPLTAHANLSQAIELLRAGAERYFVNLGLFSNYFLRERMIPHLSERGRHVDKESATFFRRLSGEIPTDPEGAKTILCELGYKLIPVDTSAHPEYRLLSTGSVELDAICILTKAESLDTKKSDEVVPSYQAVSALKQVHWVILTNGRLWRLYSSKVSSSSTNYFEIDLDGITSEDDPKLAYFISLFSAVSLTPKPEGSDLDTIFEGGQKYAQKIKDELSKQVFEGQLFLNLVRAVLSNSQSKMYREDELEEAKATALRLLYRILFVLYAESRNLLPVGNENYGSISLEGLRQKLAEFEKLPEGTELWQGLKTLFRSIENGNAKAGVPVYDGELFRETADLGGVIMKNKYLAPALRELTEIDGKGIDYQNLGVRHLGSLYEALLEYSVRQAEDDLIVYKDGTLDATYAADLKAKPKPFVKKGELYLSSGGLARKGTGSYYTPDEIVRYLTRNGLQPILEARQRSFEIHIAELNAKRGKDPELETAVIDDLLGIKVVDPAMGSGHFLVAVVDYITSWIMDRLKEHPEAPLARMIDEDREKVINEQKEKGIEITTELLTDNVILKRLVMKRCVYGVDINPLAVELAKLSLWLDSFTIGTPLTFLDHHIRVGDSLIGLWLSNLKTKLPLEETLDTWMETAKEAGIDVSEKVSMPPDLTLEQVSESRKIYNENRRKTDPARIILDLITAQMLAPDEIKELHLNFGLIEKGLHQAKKPDFWNLDEQAEAIAKRFRAFHWELEFPDAYSGRERGFDFVIMNPPWDVVEPKDDDFFSVYYPQFRLMKSKPEKRKKMNILLKKEDIRKKYELYKDTIEKRSVFYNSSMQYVKRGGGKSDSWKLFLERALNLLGRNGSLSVVIPSGIMTDEGGKQLREELFQGNIRSAYEFENRNGIFGAIHRSYKFILLVWDKTTPTESFPAAFYLHDLKSLEGTVEREKFIDMPFALVKRCAPNSLSIPEVRNEKQLEVFKKLYETQPLLEDETKGWTVSLLEELNRRNDSDIFRTDGNGWPLFEGKNFHQFIPDYEKVTFTIDPDAGLARTARRKEYHLINEAIHRNVRLAFRGVASSTNVRAMIACLLPPESFSPHSATFVHPSINSVPITNEKYAKLISYLAAIMNSFVFDFLIRTRVTMNLSFFYVYQTPIPADYSGELADRLAICAVRLNATDERYDKFAKLLGVSWRPLSMKERIELTAELNGLVARHYNLTRQELEVVLDSFDGFEEDDRLVDLEGQIHWNDQLVRKFNGEVRKRVLDYFDREGNTEGRSA